MMHLRTTLYVNSSNKCGIYQVDALSPLLFCIALNALSALLNNSKYRYHFRSGTTINYLFYMNDIKLYAKSERDVYSLMHLTRVYIRSRKVLSLYSQQRLVKKHTDGVEMPDSHIDDIAERYKHLSIQQAFSNDDSEVCCRAISEYKKQMRWVLKSQPANKDKIMAINTFTVPVIQYPAAIIS